VPYLTYLKYHCVIIQFTNDTSHRCFDFDLNELHLLISNL
jgi:hypothetical protein